MELLLLAHSVQQASRFLPLMTKNRHGWHKKMSRVSRKSIDRRMAGFDKSHTAQNRSYYGCGHSSSISPVLPFISFYQ
jgi:hypothetical protein